MHFRATGSPLPPTMTVRLTSNPSGVTFGPSPDCAVSPDGGAATCSTVSGAGARTPGTAAMAASTYSAELPFLIPDAQLDTDIDITVDVPDGFEVAGGTGTFKPYTSRTADVRMTLPAGAPFAPGGSSVAAQLAGLPSGYAGPVRLSLVDGAATLAGTTTDGCALDAGVVTCRQPADGLVGLTVVPSDPAVDTPVRIRVAPVTGYRDPATGNNTASTTLAAQPVVVPPTADLGLTLDGPVPADSDGGYTVTGHVTGLPAGYAGTVTYTLSGAPATFTSTGCTPLGQTLLCPAPAAGTVVLDVDAADTSVDNPVTVTVAKIDGLRRHGPHEQRRHHDAPGGRRGAACDGRRRGPHRARPGDGATRRRRHVRPVGRPVGDRSRGVAGPGRHLHRHRRAVRRGRHPDEHRDPPRLGHHPRLHAHPPGRRHRDHHRHGHRVRRDGRLGQRRVGEPRAVRRRTGPSHGVVPHGEPERRPAVHRHARP